jgi:uncharacterized membrane protein YczE
MNDVASSYSGALGRRLPVLPLRIGQLLVGLLVYGLAIALYVRSSWGLGPWDAFHYGLYLQTGLSIGAASILTGAVILCGTTLAGLRPGLGTVLNMILVGAFTDFLLPIIPEAPNPLAAAVYFASALFLVGLASGMYIGAGLGHGPRDGLMVALARRSGWSVRRIRTLIEAVVLAVGWAMGGTVGLGTLVIVLTVGQSVQWGLKLFRALPTVREPGPARGPGRRPFRRAA